MTLILSLEDDEKVALLLGAIFQGEGWGWRRLERVGSVAAEIRRSRPDVVTTGYQHPELSGVSLLELMKHAPGLNQIPVVFVTARAREDLCVEVTSAGLDPNEAIAGYVCKPFHARDLIAELRRVLQVASPSAMHLHRPLDA